MGGSSFSRDDYSARSTMRASVAHKTGKTVASATFAYDDDVKSGKASGVFKKLLPIGIREARDSDAHPVSIPIGILLDTTGSMMQVPKMIQAELPKLMGAFLDDKASGKKYLGDGYPAICIGAVDDYDAMRYEKHAGTLQIGQFESGLEIDDDLTHLWFTGNGGGTYQESYELGMYFYAQRTVHDHWEKRRRKGYLFIIGDEKAYDTVRKVAVEKLMGVTGMQDDMKLEDVISELKTRYHVFFIIPNMTDHYHDKALEKWWVERLGQQSVIKLEDPHRICETIVGAVAICEEYVGIEDIEADLGDMKALVPLTNGSLVKAGASGLPATKHTGGTERL